MTVQPCGFKSQGRIRTEQELTKVKKTAGSAWTPLPAHVSSINPPEIVVALRNVRDLFGGRSTQIATNESDTTDGGRTDE